ncbi:TonB-dependent receptor plug domain-containing protein, partial [Mucilaginibacter sp. 5B2]|nr:TonB-dependent receptor plug domain-containing protein [Mucilaginibacter sp. 5B2]
MLLTLCCSLAFSQNRLIRGRTTDNANQALIGVSISLKGTTTGTVSDTSGNFRINAAAGNILIISYLGYKTRELSITDRDQYNIQLFSAGNMLDETVVIGYQSISRRSVTTAVSSVGTKDIAPTTTSNVADALQGKVPGLQVFQGGGNPGTQPKLLIRGFATITGSSDPLIVVDGVITSFGSLNDINPSDIEKVDVLKDAASTAIYGSRGGSGVLLITTKRGKEKTQINFNGTTGMSQWVNPNLAGTDEFVNHYRQIYTTNNQTLPANGAVTGTNTDWWKASTRNAYTQNYNISASGSKNGLTFYGSAGYFNQTTNFRAQRNTGDYRKITTRFNVDYQISKAVKIGVSLAPRME